MGVFEPAASTMRPKSRQSNRMDMHELAASRARKQFRLIGQGSGGGMVWADEFDVGERDESDGNKDEGHVARAALRLALKQDARSLTPQHANGQSILKEARFLKKAARKLADLPDEVFDGGFEVFIPKLYRFLEQGAQEWDALLPLLPSRFSSTGQALVCERVMPVMPRPGTELEFLTRKHGIRNGGMHDKLNQGCLFRPLLGRQSQRNIGINRTSIASTSTSIMTTTINTYPLYIDQIEELGLPARDYAEAMADALAFLLWAVGIDACGVEYALARPRPRSASSCMNSERPGRNFYDHRLGDYALWVLGFDRCQKLTMDSEGMDRAAEQFWQNAPYYPTPDFQCSRDGNLWEIFRDQFLLTSWDLLDSMSCHIQMLPELFIDKVTEIVGHSRDGNNSSSSSKSRSLTRSNSIVAANGQCLPIRAAL